MKKKMKEKTDDQKDYFASKADLANTKADIIKWMFIFWVGQLAAVFAIVKLI